MPARAQTDVANVIVNGAARQKAWLSWVVAIVALEIPVELWALLQGKAMLKIEVKGLRSSPLGLMIAAAVQLLHKRMALVLPIEVGPEFSRIAMAWDRSLVVQHIAPRTTAAVVQRSIHPLPLQGPR